MASFKADIVFHLEYGLNRAIVGLKGTLVCLGIKDIKFNYLTLLGFAPVQALILPARYI
jgi:hypothetical protein